MITIINSIIISILLLTTITLIETHHRFTQIYYKKPQTIITSLLTLSFTILFSLVLMNSTSWSETNFKIGPTPQNTIPNPK